MKIGFVGAISAYPQAIGEKHLGPDHRKRRPGDGKQGQGKNQDPDQESDSEDDRGEQVDYAVAQFMADQQTQQSGLTAATESDGRGPGLRVVLKDGQGQLVRLLSGEEFLKLRQAISPGLAVPGKILDQKL